MNLSIIILAAGGSTRLGKPKQLLKYEGKTLIENCIESVIMLAPKTQINVVLGAYFFEILPFVQNYEVNILENRNWQNGMSASIKMGVLAGLESNSDAILFLTSDQIFVTKAYLKTLITEFKNNQSKICASIYEQEMGIPMIVPKDFFDDLLRLEGDKGGKFLTKKYPSQTRVIAFEKGIVDIDTIEDVSKYLPTQD